MGEVYRAHDAKLNRAVALKVLPELFALDRDRLARFKREAQVLASLNHPNIAAIYGLEESSGVQALVLELVEGPTLADHIFHGPIPLDQALPIARQIAEAVEAAHEQGIIHRDLKPANIKLRPDGVVKVLDFGLARIVTGGDGSTSDSPTITIERTREGLVMGTAPYMSPEQARGQTVDKRTDIWAFGCVLYEMLTGARAFEGDDVSDTMAAVLRGEPNWTSLPVSTPTPIRRLLRRCLEKDRTRRLADAADARLDIEEGLTAPSAIDGAAAHVRPASPGWKVANVSVALLIGAAVAGSATWFTSRPGPSPTLDVARFTIAPPTGQVLGVAQSERDVAIAPDGRHLVYQTGIQGARQQLSVRAIDQLEAVPLHGIVASGWAFISPDSRRIGFFQSSELRTVSMTGGAPFTVCRVQGLPTGATWGPDDTIIFATNDATTGLFSVPAKGGEPTILTKADPAQNERDHAFPSMLPDGHTVLVTLTSAGSIENTQVAVLDLKTGQKKILIRGGSQAEYVETGHLVYAAAGTLRAVRFDLARLEVLSDPVLVVERVLTKPLTSVADFSVSRNGTLVYVSGGTSATTMLSTLVWVDRKGHEDPIAAPPRGYVYPRLSPDGTRIALDIRDQQNDIWIWDFGRQNLYKLTTDPGLNRIPAWTRDSKRVAFTAERDGVESIHWQAFDGSGTMERLSIGTQLQAPQAFSPDGTRLIFVVPPGPFDVGVIDLGANHKATMLLHTAANETNAELSPNGRWLAYQSDETGREEVYVRPFPKVDTAVQLVSSGGGTRPLWSSDGRELFYFVLPGTIMAVPVSAAADIAFGTPEPVVKGTYSVPQLGRTYDVSGDGQRFLLLKDAPTPDGRKPAAPELHVVLNWFEELKRLVPTN